MKTLIYIHPINGSLLSFNIFYDVIIQSTKRDPRLVSTTFDGYIGSLRECSSDKLIRVTILV